MALIGRAAERAALDEALLRARLVTLVGTAGVGKTALARALAHEKRAPFADLSDAQSTDGVLSALAAPLGVRLVDVRERDDAHTRLVDALVAQGHALFVVDNAEHVKDEVAAFARAMLARQQASLVATSRVPLGVVGEETLDVHPLDREAAVALLVERARDVHPDDRWRDVARRVVDQIDRLPLAIELFASRLDILTIDELLERLSDPLAVLRDPTRRDQRHTDLERALAWTWDLTSERERALLFAIATCRSGATIAVLEDMMREADDVAPSLVMDDLSSLHRRHLIRAERVDERETRYFLLETVRAFVEKRARDEGRSARLMGALARAVTMKSRAYAQKTRTGVRALAHEIDNLARVLVECAAGHPAEAARAGLLLDAHFAMHGPTRAHGDILDAAVRAAERADEDALLTRLLTRRGDAHRKSGRLVDAERDLTRAAALASDDEARAEVASSHAMLAMMSGDLDLAHTLVEHSVATARRAEAIATLSRALERGGSVALVRGEYALVEERCGHALALADVAKDERSSTNALTYLGIARLDRGLHDAARAAFDDARARYVALDDQWSVAVCDAYLALIALDEGSGVASPARDPAALLDLAASAARRTGHARLLAFVDGMRGVASHLVGDLSAAEAHLRAALALARHVHDLLAACVAAGHLAGVLAARAFLSPGALDEARALLDEAHGFAALLPNPSGRRALSALSALIALADGDAEGARARRAEAKDVPGVHLRLACRIVDAALAKAGLDVERAASTGTATGADMPALALMDGGARIRLKDGSVVDLSRRGPLRRVLLALVDAHRQGTALDVHALIDRGWPDEKVGTEAGTARVYSAIKSLRRMGMEELIVTRDDGYTLSADARVVGE